jgi:hypothetical protein
MIHFPHENVFSSAMDYYEGIGKVKTIKLQV